MALNKKIPTSVDSHYLPEKASEVTSVTSSIFGILLLYVAYESSQYWREKPVTYEFLADQYHSSLSIHEFKVVDICWISFPHLLHFVVESFFTGTLTLVPRLHSSVLYESIVPLSITYLRGYLILLPLWFWCCSLLSAPRAQEALAGHWNRMFPAIDKATVA